MIRRVWRAVVVEVRVRREWHERRRVELARLRRHDRLRRFTAEALGIDPEEWQIRYLDELLRQPRRVEAPVEREEDLG